MDLNRNTAVMTIAVPQLSITITAPSPYRSIFS